MTIDWRLAGYNARFCGVLLHQNPWRDIDGGKARAWARGWRDAHERLLLSRRR